jgi:hypothetical protein
MDIKITKTEGSKLAVVSPYNPDVPARARALGGKWSASDRAWVFDSRDEQAVRALLLDVYGSDGSDDGDVATIRITTNRGMCSRDREALYVGPVEVGRAFGRDSGAKLADNVVFIEGSLTSGGSRKNWDTRTSDDAVFEVRDIPRAVAEKIVRENANDWGIASIVIVDDDADRSVALKTERERLVARIAEIDAELNA